MNCDSFFHENTISITVGEKVNIIEDTYEDTYGLELQIQCPLRRWDESVSQMTKLNKVEHLKEPYSALIDKMRS